MRDGNGSLVHRRSDGPVRRSIEAGLAVAEQGSKVAEGQDWSRAEFATQTSMAKPHLLTPVERRVSDAAEVLAAGQCTSCQGLYTPIPSSLLRAMLVAECLLSVKAAVAQFSSLPKILGN